jgi:hypothetical protein
MNLDVIITWVVVVTEDMVVVVTEEDMVVVVTEGDMVVVVTEGDMVVHMDMAAMVGPEVILVVVMVMVGNKILFVNNFKNIYTK